MALFPHIPAHVHRVAITDHEHADGRSPVGVIYQFLANVTDVATIPKLTHTTITVGDKATVSEPWLWPAAAADRAIRVGVEETSDAGCASLNEEARKAWQSMADELRRRGNWVSLIGVHGDVIDRILEPLHLRHVEIRTLHDDLLARMFAMGSAEIARCASVLHLVEERQLDREPEWRSTFERFLWPRQDDIPEWAAARYDEALAGGYQVVQSRFAPQEEVLP